jgi:hypothetical protein
MQTLIKQLIEQATVKEHTIGEYGDHIWRGKLNIEEYTKLVIKECIKSLWTEECNNSDLAMSEFSRNRSNIKEHFGIKE